MNTAYTFSQEDGGEIENTYIVGRILQKVILVVLLPSFCQVLKYIEILQT